MRVRFCCCFVTFKMKGKNIWAKCENRNSFLWKHKSGEDSSKIDRPLKDQDVDFYVFSCSATGNTFFTNAFNCSDLNWAISVRILKYLCCKIVYSLKCCGHLMSQVELHCFAHLFESAFLSLLLLGSFWTHLWTFWMLSLAEHHSSSATLQSLSGSSTVPWGKNVFWSQVLEMKKKQVALCSILADFLWQLQAQ